MNSFRPIQQQEEEVSILENMEVGQRPAVVASNSDVEKVTLELEEWKIKQKELFKQQVFRQFKLSPFISCLCGTLCTFRLVCIVLFQPM